MKILFNRQPKGTQPWGGGNRIVTALAEELINRGHDVCYALNEGPFDVMMCFNPNAEHETGAPSLGEMMFYKEKHGGRLVVRVGDIGLQGKPELNQFWHTMFGLLPLKPDISFIFPSRWAARQVGAREDVFDVSIIPNYAPAALLAHRRPKASLPNPFSLVTHHWSDNSMKGFDTYEALARISLQPNAPFKFTFIGRWQNTPLRKYRECCIDPLGLEDLAKELPKHDIYISASCGETGPNHIADACAAGLPVLIVKGPLQGASIEADPTAYVFEFDKQGSGADVVRAARCVTSTTVTYSPEVERIVRIESRNSLENFTIPHIINVIQEHGQKENKE